MSSIQQQTSGLQNVPNGTIADYVKCNWKQNQFRSIKHSKKNRIGRVLWSFVYTFLFRFSPRPAHRFRITLLRMFGAKIGNDCRVYPSVRFWAPWNLEMRDGSCLGESVDCYAVGQITIGENVTVSQRTVLCTATHDTTLLHFPLIIKPITLEPFSWVAAEAFIMPGVTIGEGTVVAARALVLKDLPAWKIVGGTPAKVIANREIRVSPTEPARDALSSLSEYE